VADSDSQWSVKADAKAPKPALDFFKAKVPLLPADYRALNAKDKQRAFSVAHAVRLDQVNDVMKGIERAIAKGDSFETFKRGVKDQLNQAWGANGYALKNVFLTNVMSAYSAGNWRGITRPEAKAARPLGRYSAVGDDRTCPICGPCDGVTLPLDDPFWQENNVPQHMSCRCEIEALRADEGEVTDPDDLPDVEAQDGFGIPAEIGEFEPDLASKDKDAAAIYLKQSVEQDFTFVPPGWETPLAEIAEPGLERPSLPDAVAEAVRSTRSQTIVDSELSSENKAILLRNFEKADALKPEFDGLMQAIAAHVDGNAMLAPLKGVLRSLDKIENKYNGNASKLGDILRGTIAVSSPSEYERTITEVKAHFTVIDVDQAPKPGGYRDVNIKVDLGDGLKGEIQINTPAMLAAKEIGHKPYEEWRKLKEAPDQTPGVKARIAELTREMEAIYAPARRGDPVPFDREAGSG
jgi:SPP1 gp7 family putative phage head morphogenesis protein